MAINLIQHNKGDTLVASEVNERYPVITNGLVAHYPLDGRGGCIDVVNGDTTYDNIDNGVNILDALNIDWRNPSNWNTACTYDEAQDALIFPNPSVTAYITVYIPIKTSKKFMMSVTSKSTGSGIFYAGTISCDANKNWLPGHLGSLDYFVCVGYGLTPTYTTYVNDVIGGAPRTGEDSNTGNYNAWHPGTKYALIMLLPDYNGSSGPHYIKNLKIWYTDADTSSVLIENRGIAIQENTTNLLNFRPNPSFSPWSNFTGKCVELILPNNKLGIRLLSYNGGGCQYMVYGDITVTPNTTYTVSAKVRSNNLGGIHQNLFYFYQYDSGNAYVTEQGYFNPANTSYIGDGWYWAWGTFTVGSTTTRLSFQGYEYSGGLSIEIYDWQFEQRAFPTAFVGYGINKSKGGLYIKIPQVIQNSSTPFPFTVTCEYEYMLNGGQNGEGNEPSVCYPITWWGYNGVLNQIGRSTFTAKGGRFTLICRTSDFSFYWNDVLVNSGGYYNGVRPPLDQVIAFGVRGFEAGYPMMNALYSNVSFYNRELSTSEMIQLSATKTQIGPTSYIAPSFNEKPKVQKYFHFPLGFNTNDITNTILANTNTNIAFENGACWVGQQTTNLLYNSGQNFVNINSIYGAGARSTKTMVNNYHDVNNNSAYFKVFTASEVIRVYCNESDLSWGTTYTTSLYVEKLKSISMDWNDIGGSYFENNNILKITTNQSNGGGYNGTYHFFDINMDENLIYKLSNAQVEGKPFRSPFVWGTRGTGHLTYNLYRDIGLDWSGNWSICYWKKPMGTVDNNLTGYNIDSIGANTNANGGYMWFGKEAGVNGMRLGGYHGDVPSTPYNFTPTDYFDKWHFITLIKNGTTVTFTAWNIGGNTHTSQLTATLSSNSMVCDWGYDLMLGGWDNQGAPNAFYRDLVVAKYAMTNLEIQNIRSFNVNNNETYLNKFIEI